MSHQRLFLERHNNKDNTYGWALMSAQERTAYRDKMPGAKIYDECRAVQNERHTLMAHGLDPESAVDLIIRGMLT